MNISDDVLSLIMALGENSVLRERFYKIADLPENLKSEVLHKYIDELKKITNEERVIRTFEMLEDPSFFAIALECLKKIHPRQ